MLIESLLWVAELLEVSWVLLWRSRAALGVQHGSAPQALSSGNYWALVHSCSACKDYRCCQSCFIISSSISVKSLLQTCVFYCGAPSVPWGDFNSFPGEMHKSSPPVSAESLPAPSPASLPKAPLLLSLRCAQHLAVIWWDKSHLAASSVDVLCTSLCPASQYNHGTAPNAALNSSFCLSKSLATEPWKWKMGFWA